MIIGNIKNKKAIKKAIFTNYVKLATKCCTIALLFSVATLIVTLTTVITTVHAQNNEAASVNSKENTFFTFDNNNILYFFKTTTENQPIFIKSYNLEKLKTPIRNVVDIIYNERYRKLFIATDKAVYKFSSIETRRNIPAVSVSKFHEIANLARGEKIINLSSFLRGNNELSLSIATSRRIVLITGITSNTDRYDAKDVYLKKYTFSDKEQPNIKSAHLSTSGLLFCNCYDNNNFAITQWLMDKNGEYSKNSKKMKFKRKHYETYLTTISTESFLLQMATSDSVTLKENNVKDHFFRVIAKNNNNFYNVDSNFQTELIFSGISNNERKITYLGTSKINNNKVDETALLVMNTGEIVILTRNFTIGSSNFFTNIDKGQVVKTGEQNIMSVFFLNENYDIMYWTENMDIVVMTSNRRNFYKKTVDIRKMYGENITILGGGKIF